MFLDQTNDVEPETILVVSLCTYRIDDIDILELRVLAVWGLLEIRMLVGCCSTSKTA